MQPSPQTPPQKTSALGTLGWVGAVLLGAVLALILLSALGPVGGH
jgi:hypothetical protein